MAQDRVRIADVADSLGLSTATVSKVIHGKTEKISDETVKRSVYLSEKNLYPACCHRPPLCKSRLQAKTAV